MPAYLRSGWNVLDFCVVVICSILSLMNMDAVQGLQALRTSSRSAAVSTLGVVMVLFFGIFDMIIAMQLFGGRLGSCLDPLGVYTDSEIYVPGFECIEKEACTFQHITGVSETFPPADLYNRAVLASLAMRAAFRTLHNFRIAAARWWCASSDQEKSKC